MAKYSDEEEWFINHWNDILTYPTIGDLCEALSEPADVLSAKYRHLRQRCLLLDRRDRTPRTHDVSSLENEVWASVLGWDSFYAVSDLGRVKSLDREVIGRKYKSRILKQNPNSYGYLCVNVAANGVTKSVAVHRLVLEGFTGYHPGLVVRHKDNNKRNNRLSNLEWGTHGDNMQDWAEEFDSAALTILDHLEDS